MVLTKNLPMPLMTLLFLSSWISLKTRNTAKGKLKFQFHFRLVYIWDKQSPESSKGLLVLYRRAKKEEASGILKNNLSISFWNILTLTNPEPSLLNAPIKLIVRLLKNLYASFIKDFPSITKGCKGS